MDACTSRSEPLGPESLLLSPPAFAGLLPMLPMHTELQCGGCRAFRKLSRLCFRGFAARTRLNKLLLF